MRDDPVFLYDANGEPLRGPIGPVGPSVVRNDKSLSRDRNAVYDQPRSKYWPHQGKREMARRKGHNG